MESLGSIDSCRDVLGKAIAKMLCLPNDAGKKILVRCSESFFLLTRISQIKPAQSI